MGHVCRCPEGDHPTFGACMRAKNIRVAYCGQGGGDATAQKATDRELHEYREARRQGVQPEGTRLPQIRAAMEASQETGVAYGS
jgi:hypothetical protein